MASITDRRSIRHLYDATVLTATTTAQDFTAGAETTEVQIVNRSATIACYVRIAARGAAQASGASSILVAAGVGYSVLLPVQPGAAISYIRATGAASDGTLEAWEIRG